VNSVAMADISAPQVDYWLILPILIVFGGGLISVVVEAAAPRRWRYWIQVSTTLITLAAAFGAVVYNADRPKAATLARSIVIDGPALFAQGTLVLLAMIAVAAMAERFGTDEDAFTSTGASVPGSAYEAATARAGWTQSEIYPLTLFSLGGMMLFPAANDLLTLFVALEVFSLPLYLLCGLARRRRLLSQEAALKYFLLGAFSSAFYLFGAALLFGFASSLYFPDIATAISSRTDADGLLGVGVILVLVGVLFKVGAVPFHSWTPDVYQGAPTPVTGFMAACTKVAAFGALLRLSYVALAPGRWDWQLLVWAVAIATMVIGAVVAVTQTDVKRMLAYSSIAHAGFILTGVLAFDRVGVAATLFYVASYGFSTVGMFAVVTLVRDSAGEATHLSQWAGLARKSPLVAGIFTFFLLTLAGIPLTSGFIAKYGVFAAAIAHGGTGLAVVGILSSAIAAFFYARVIVLMYFSNVPGEESDAVFVVAPSVWASVSIGVAVLVTVLLGVWPNAVLSLAKDAAVFVS
jgi:NADH-quinone oxidoreductase subunit N